MNSSVVVSGHMATLAKIKRERDLVKSSLVSDAAKAKLLAQLDAQVAQISKELEALEGTPGAAPPKR